VLCSEETLNVRRRYEFLEFRWFIYFYLALFSRTYLCLWYAAHIMSSAHHYIIDHTIWKAIIRVVRFLDQSSFAHRPHVKWSHIICASAYYNLTRERANIRSTQMRSNFLTHYDGALRYTKSYRFIIFNRFNIFPISIPTTWRTQEAARCV